MMYTKLNKRIISLLLCLAMIIAYIPVSASAADPATDTRVADNNTMDQWQEYFGSPDKTGTEFAGGVWTDKSVMTKPDGFRSNVTMLDENKNFLIALSAIAANQQIVGYSTSPVDVMLVLDASGSMQGNKATTMVQAVNETLHSLLEQNRNNRVGVVMFSGNSSTSSLAGSNTATVLLPLDRYTTQSTQTVGSGSNRKTIPIYLRISNNNVSVANTVRDSQGQIRSGSKQVSGGTYIQNGIYKGWQEFSKVTDVKVPSGNVQAGAQRTPVMVLFSDGQPTLATDSYTNIGNSQSTYGNGTESSTSWRTVFLSQLTAAWAKGKMAAHYGTPAKFYTLGLGTGNSDYATAVLNPTGSSDRTLSGYWTNFFDPDNLDRNNNVSVSNNWKLTKDSAVASKEYADAYYLAANTDDMLEAFKNIVENIELDAAGHVTLVEDAGENLSGYITFTDELGMFMEVKDIKGLELGSNLYTGAKFARKLGDGSYGSMQDPTPLGDEFILSTRERLNLDTTTAQELVLAAYQDGQISYTSDTEFSNYLGWYSDDDGTYLGFWDKDTGITAQGAPEGATWINKSYLFQDTMGDSDMMHIVVLVATHIASGMQVVQYKIPASLIPMVTYEVTLEGSDVTKMESITRKEAFPLRLIYEVGLYNDINSVNVAAKLAEAIDAGYGHSHKEADGSYAFYTNLWGAEHGDTTVDYTDPMNHKVAQSHFHPAVGNDRYYYTADTLIYRDTRDTKYNGTAAPSGDGYYRQHHFYTADGYQTKYVPIAAEALAAAAAYGRQADGFWYVPAGTVFQQIDRFKMLKDPNVTGTLEYYDHPVVVKTDNKYDTYAFLGNNGKIAIKPEQGIKLTKTVTETVDGASDIFTFTVTISEAVAEPKVTDSNGNPWTGAWNVESNVITVSLKAAETVYITGLPAGVTYTVAEVANSHYTASSSNATGTVELGAIKPVDFVNVPKGYGNLIISKDVEHPFTTVPEALHAKEFSITVTLSGEDVANKQFAIAGTEPAQYVTTDANGSFTVSLKDNGSMTIVGLPENTTFVTTETLDAEMHAGFTMDAERSTLSGKILKNDTVQTHIVNVYAPDAPETKLQISGEKILTHETGAFQWSGRTFTIRLEQYDPAAGTYTTLGEKQVTEGNLAYLFDDEITLTELGSHYFKVSEVIPTENRIEGMSYDATTGRIEVIVSDNNVDGVMELAVYDFDTGNAIEPENGVVTYTKDFENIYTTESTYVEFTIDKNVVDPHNTGTTEAGFLFNLYEVIGGVTQTTPAYAMRTVLVNGEGQATFHIPVTKVGTRTFILKESAPAEFDKIPGMLYDTTEYTVIVEGKPNADSKLEATVTILDAQGSEVSDVAFVNKIELEPLVLKPYVTKTLTGREPLADDVFSFHLEQTNGSFVPGSMPDGYSDDVRVTYAELVDDGNAYYDEITVTKVGTYYFRSIEIAGTKPGIAYDNSIYHITVTVTWENDQLVKDVQFVKVGVGVPSTGMDSVQFVNSYTNSDSEEVTIQGNKSLTGRTRLPGEFSFQLKEGNEVLQTVSNLADGSFVFAPITYTAADVGVHTYTVSEINDHKGGVVYDETVYTVTVTVTDNGKDDLLVKTEGADNITFSNAYSATPVDVSFGGTKTWYNTDLQSKLALQGDEFTFVLYASNENYTQQGAQIATDTNDADGSFGFTLHYTSAGSYYYLLREQNDSAPNVNYDTGIYQIHIHVYDDGVGTLIGAVDSIKHVGTGSSTIAFLNEYTPDATELVIAGEKRLTGRDLADGEFSFHLLQNGDILQTVENTGKDFAFAPIAFEYSGTYEYQVIEELPDGIQNGLYQGVLYDLRVFDVIVTVTDRNGTLEATYEVSTGNSATALRFENTYTVTNFTDFDLAGQKNLHLGSEPLAFGDREFRFAIYDANGQPLRTVTAAADGSFLFENIPLTSAGTHTFTVSEVDGGLGGITYDTSIYTVTVVVEDNGLGDLIASAPVVTLNGSTAPLVFNNTYSRTPAKIVISGTKSLYKRTLQAGQFQFALYETDSSYNLESKQFVAIAHNAEDGSFSFSGDTIDKLNYTTEGIRHYVLMELSDDPIDEVRYDTTVYRLNVTVEDDHQGHLTAELKCVNGAVDQISFLNVPHEDIVHKDVYYPENDTVSIDGKKVFAGEILEYAISYKNFTNEPLEITITDHIPAHTSFVSADKGGSCTAGVVTWTADVEPGATLTVSFQVKVDENIGAQNIPNKATVVEGKNSYETNEVFNYTVVDEVKKDVFYPENDTISINGKKVYAGETLLYKISYKNTATEKATVTITDSIPAHTSFVSADKGGSCTEGVVTWTADVEPGATLTVSFQVKVDENIGAQNIPNKATVVEGKNSYETNEVFNYTVVDEVEKSVFYPENDTISINRKKIYAGETLLYRISYKNTATEKATVTITDSIPAHTSFVSADKGGSCTAGVVTWTADVEPGATLTVSFQVKVDENIGAERLPNKAIVVDGKNAYETNEVFNYTVKDDVKKEVFRTNAPTVNIDGKAVENSETLIYAIHYKNNDSKKVTVTISDTVPEHTTYVDGSADNGGVYKDGTITWTVDVEAGAELTVTFRVTVNKVSAAIRNKAVVVEGKNTYTTNEVSNTTEIPVVPPTPQTGDTTQLHLWIALMFISAGGILTISLCGRKKKEAEEQ